MWCIGHQSSLSRHSVEEQVECPYHWSRRLTLMRPFGNWSRTFRYLTPIAPDSAQGIPSLLGGTHLECRPYRAGMVYQDDPHRQPKYIQNGEPRETDHKQRYEHAYPVRSDYQTFIGSCINCMYLGSGPACRPLYGTAKCATITNYQMCHKIECYLLSECTIVCSPYVNQHVNTDTLACMSRLSGCSSQEMHTQASADLKIAGFAQRHPCCTPL
jgi:hypothetical protein